MSERGTHSGIQGRRRPIVVPSSGRDLPPASPSGPGTYPLSPAQERLWFHHRLEPASTLYNVPFAFRLRGPLHLGALRSAVAQILERHQVLRAGISDRDGVPVATVRELEFDLRTEHPVPGAEPELLVSDLLRAETSVPFDLCRGPFLRVTVQELGNHDNLLVAGAHHIAWDGWSRSIFLRELSAAYRAVLGGVSAELPELPIQFGDHALRQRNCLDTPRLRRQLDYWVSQLKGATAALPLREDRPTQTGGGPAAGTIRARLDPACLAGARHVAAETGSTLFMVLLAAFQVLLLRWTGEPDVVVGTNVAGRSPDTEGLIGFFLNQLTLRTRLDGNPTFQECIRRVRDTSLEAFEHQEVPFDRVVNALRSQREGHATPLFRVLFTVQNTPRSSLQLEGVTAEPLPVDLPESKLDLSLFVAERDGQLSTLWTYRSDLFHGDTIARLGLHYEGLLLAALRDSARRIHDYELPLPARQTEARCVSKMRAPGAVVRREVSR